MEMLGGCKVVCWKCSEKSREGLCNGAGGSGGTHVLGLCSLIQEGLTLDGDTLDAALPHTLNNSVVQRQSFAFVWGGC